MALINYQPFVFSYGMYKLQSTPHINIQDGSLCTYRCILLLKYKHKHLPYTHTY